jgi:hypothetical protein
MSLRILLTAYTVPRQLGDIGNLLGSLVGSILPANNAVKRETLNPTILGDDVKRVRLTYGPYKLRASNSTQREGNFFSFDPQGTGWAYLLPDFPTGITVLSVKLSIGYADGTEIANSNGVYNHHALFLDISKGISSNLQCQGSSITIPAINSIAGSAADIGDGIRPNVTTRPITGNFIAKDHKILITGDLVNYNKEIKEVYMNIDLQYVEGKAIGLLENSIHLVPVGACESKFFGMDSIFFRPPRDRKQFSLKGENLEVKEDGKIMVVRGHLHGMSIHLAFPINTDHVMVDGGVNMVFRLNGQEVCNSRAEYKASNVGGGHSDMHTDDGMISGMSGCSKPIDVKKGDKVAMEAFYDMEKHPA